MAVMRQQIFASGVSDDIARFISGSIWASSQQTHSAVWHSWVAWCSTNDLDPVSVSEIALIQYLWFLFHDKHRAAVTLGVHHSAISSLADPLGSHLSESKFLSCFMEAVFLESPPASAQSRDT